MELKIVNIYAANTQELSWINIEGVTRCTLISFQRRFQNNTDKQYHLFVQPPLNFNTGIQKTTFFTSFTYFYTTAHIVQGGTCSVLHRNIQKHLPFLLHYTARLRKKKDRVC